MTRSKLEARDRERAIPSCQSSASGAKGQLRNAGGECKPGLRLNRQGLQCERAARAADERVRANPGTDSRRTADAGIVTRERSGLGSLGRSKTVPGQYALIGCADIEAEFANRAVIMLTMSASRGENALHLLTRRDDETEASRNLAAQRADFDALLRNRGLRACDQYGERRRAENGTNVPGFSLSLRVELQWANEPSRPNHQMD